MGKGGMIVQIPFGIAFAVFLGLLSVGSAAAQTDWDHAARQVVGQMLTERVNFPRDTPAFLFETTSQPANEALSRALTDAGYTPAATGSYPRIALTRASQIQNRFWQRPYSGCLMRVEVRDEEQLKNVFEGVHLNFKPSWYQIPGRFLALFISGGLIYSFIYRASLYRSRPAWIVGFGVWLTVGLFLLEGYVLWGVGIW